jgi:type III secretion system FlhB-like substrate exporter
VLVGAEVPTDLYRAVAEVLAFVYRIRRQAGGART